MRLVRPSLPTVLKGSRSWANADDEALQRMAQNGCVVVPVASVGVSFRTSRGGAGRNAKSKRTMPPEK